MALHPLHPAKPTKVYDQYWRFAVDRQKAFFNRIRGIKPWTEDSILARYKFTNAYRASDRVSQYLIRNVIYSGSFTSEELFFRILLFKTFNKIETWEALKREFGEPAFKQYSFSEYNKFLSSLMKEGRTIYSAAYIMSSGKTIFGYARKHSNHLKVIESMMEDEVPKKVKVSKSMKEVFELLRSYPTVGNFLAFQYAIDLNYSELTNFSEMDFVVPGPGAFEGIHKCFSDLGGLNETEIIALMAKRQKEEFARLHLDFMDLWGRPLQLIDCQNLFCEIGKYARVAFPDISGGTGRTRIKQVFKPKNEPLSLFYPPKWKINEAIQKEPQKASKGD